MGKKYFCDYCDRSFKDNPDARKKHLSSLQHVDNRLNHYKLYKDPETILIEETAKIPCKRFMSQTKCMFGESCRFSHYTPQMIMELRQLVAGINQAKQTMQEPIPDEIIKEFFETSYNSEPVHETNYPHWNYPQELLNYINLPPSLWPITHENIGNSNFGHWG